MKIFKSIILAISLTLFVTSCGFYKVDQRQMPDGAKAKARKMLIG